MNIITVELNNAKLMENCVKPGKDTQRFFSILSCLNHYVRVTEILGNSYIYLDIKTKIERLTTLAH